MPLWKCGVARIKQGSRPRITRISQMFLRRPDPESSAGFQPAVSQNFILQTDQPCRPTLVSSDALQITNLGYSPADPGRRAFGLTSVIEAPAASFRICHWECSQGVISSARRSAKAEVRGASPRESATLNAE